MEPTPMDCRRVRSRSTQNAHAPAGQRVEWPVPRSRRELDAVLRRRPPVDSEPLLRDVADAIGSWCAAQRPASKVLAGHGVRCGPREFGVGVAGGGHELSARAVVERARPFRAGGSCGPPPAQAPSSVSESPSMPSPIAMSREHHPRTSGSTAKLRRGFRRSCSSVTQSRASRERRRNFSRAMMSSSGTRSFATWASRSTRIDAAGAGRARPPAPPSPRRAPRPSRRPTSSAPAPLLWRRRSPRRRPWRPQSAGNTAVARGPRSYSRSASCCCHDEHAHTDVDERGSALTSLAGRSRKSTAASVFGSSAGAWASVLQAANFFYKGVLSTPDVIRLPVTCRLHAPVHRRSAAAS